ncbi:MAG: response regulator transcription factor [Actinobacteria bacterium]|nr:response regulator transcription factor [Actinomycetota bacterium]
MTELVRVLLAHHDAPTRTGIRLELEDGGFEICGEAAEAGAAVAIAEREEPQVCLVDENLPGGAILAVDAIYRRLPATKLVVLTDSEDPKSLLAAIRAGASGYVRTDLDPTRLAATLRGVLAGEAALSRRLTFRLLETLRTRERGRSAPTTPGGPSMTDRELEVLELMSEGLPNKTIANRLSISERTVTTHDATIYSKLHVNNRVSAIQEAMRRRILSFNQQN